MTSAATWRCHCDQAVEMRRRMDRPRPSDPPTDFTFVNVSEDGEVSCSHCWDFLGVLPLTGAAEVE